jgi:hypothetical protein
MLIGIFKSNQKVINVLVILLSILLWIPSFWIGQNNLLTQPVSFFYVNNNVVEFLISSILIGLQGVYLNYIVNEFKLLKTRTHLPALFYVLLNVGSYCLLVFTPLLIVNALLLFVLHQFFLIYNEKIAFSSSFIIGFAIAVAALFYFPVVIIFPLLWFVLLYTKPPNWRELVISVLGFLVPIAFYVAYYYLTDQMIRLVFFGWEEYQIFSADILTDNFFEDSFFYILFIIGVFVGFSIAKNISSHVVKVRKYLVILVLLTALLMATQLLNSSDTIASYVLITIPLSIFFADYFNNIKRVWLAELLLVVLLGATTIGYFS